MNVLHWLRDKARALFALALLAFAIATVTIAMGAPPGVTIVATVITAVAVAIVAPDIGLMLFAWILTEAKKAARNATPNYATNAGAAITSTNALDFDDTVNTGGGRFRGRLAAGTFNTGTSTAEGCAPLRD